MSNSAARYSLQTKVSLTLSVVIAAFVVLTWIILQSVIAPAFDDLESSAAATDLVRAEMALKTDIENLEAVTADWAPWDDIYYYVRGENSLFEKSNLDRPTLANLGLDFMAVFALDGELMWGQVLQDGESLPIDGLGVLNREDPRSALLIGHSSPDSDTVGIVKTDAGPAIISSKPILRSDDSGPVAGALIMGQFLNDARLQRIRERTEVAVSWLFTDDPRSAAAITDNIGLSEGQIRMDVGEESITSYKTFADIHGNPLLMLRAESPRRISALGDQALHAGLLFLCVVSVLIVALIWIILQRSILAPLQGLAGHIDDIRESGDLTRTSNLVAGGEIGELARAFDSLTRQVHDARKALVEQSFKAGKADTAAEVLHNIRNAMTPLINGLGRVSRAMKAGADLRVADALEQLQDTACEPERRDKLIQYVQASFDRLAEVRNDALDDMDMVTSQARQVEAILADQERFANVAPVSESLPVEDVVYEAANVIPKGVKPAIDLDVDESLSAYRVRAHRIGLLQVLGNLILNAFESIQRAGRSNGEIALFAASEVFDDKPMVRLTVRDNGTGFDTESGKRIFQRGFTSKQDDDCSGLGLHWCANAVAGMGGRIVAESPGEGQGAEFHVLLPAAQGG
ncbi:MAG: CHASE4 domain-containing protein [Woeseiaceae bacterium]|nr:CHASE4 domain-containing protein [Woeseiaceae bacterium]